MADEVVIRGSKPEDVDRIAAITVAAWEPAYEHYRENLGEDLFDRSYDGNWKRYKSKQVMKQCRDDPECVLVAEVAGTVVGFCTFAVDEDRGIGEIGNNAVDPAHQDAGIATQLYESVLATFRDRGVAYATVETGLEETYAPARRAYERVGFDIERRSIRYWQEL